MRGLHGTQDRYLPEIMRTGLCRPSAAFFCLPDVIREEVRLRLTLACAVYHALGLSVLRFAIRERMTVSEALTAQGVEQLAVLLLEGLPGGGPAGDLYLIEGCAAYPYVKVSAWGPAEADQAAVLKLSAGFFNSPIHIQAASVQSRFFQKMDGRTQYLENCDMAVLRMLCEDGAGWLLERYRTILMGE